MKPQDIQREKDSQALINTNGTEFVRYRAARQKIVQDRQVAQDVKILKNEVGEIKNEVLGMRNDIQLVLQLIKGV